MYIIESDRLLFSNYPNLDKKSLFTTHLNMQSLFGFKTGACARCAKWYNMCEHFSSYSVYILFVPNSKRKCGFSILN